MDSVSLQREPKLISEQDTDIVDFHPVVEVDPQESYPSRPASRLGFNGDQLSPAPSEGAGDSEAVQWSRSLFQSVGISNLQTSAIKAGPAMLELPAPPAVAAEGRSLGSMDVDRKSPSTGDKSFASSNRTPSGDSRKAPDPRSKPPTTSPRPVSRLCFPFVTTPRPKTPVATRRPPRHKYSCFPSRMSPVPAARPCPIRQRHNYTERGYSRLALQHAKWFWSLREDEYKHDVDQTKPCPDTLPEQSAIPSNYPGSQTPCTTPPSPPMTIHPRRGDIAALRDPYCVHIDRCFAGLATWTIGKTLWMFDLHMAAEHARARSWSAQEEDVSDLESDSEMETDSDATLVESESECELELELPLPASPSKRIQTPKVEEFNHPDGGKRRPAVPDSNLGRGEHYVKAQTALPPPVYFSAPPSKNTFYSISPWTTNWYHRWDLLTDLTRRDGDWEHASFASDQHPARFTTTNDSARPPLSVTRPTMKNPWDDRIEIIDAHPLCYGLVT